ncbi:secreted in xylem 2 [Fusarium coicis]|nr:secreted in xylem 2 [Fusarium coicis]
MFFKRALVALFAAWTISVAANPVADPLPDDSHLPNLRLSRREVQDLKENQKFPPGYVHKMVTFGTGEDTTTVPIVEADPDMLLDDENGIKARSLAPRGSCFSFPMPSSGCMIDYCWIDSGGHTYSAAITIRGSNGQSNPSSVTSNDPANLSLNNVFNDGYNGWFPTGHECSNSDTQIYTDHRCSRPLDKWIQGTAAGFFFPPLPRAKMARIRELSIGYIIDFNLPFTAFNGTHLQELLHKLDSDLYAQIP